MLDFKRKTAAAIALAAAKAFPDSVITEDEILQNLAYPPDTAMGDVAFPCFSLSRTLRAAPPKIASSLLEALGESDVFTAEVAGGYLNFRATDKYFAEYVLADAESAGEKYGASDEGDGKTVVLDYASPNVAKPFHIGHLGTTVIGHSLKLIHEFCGYKCVGINYLGDWGTQFGKLITAFRKWGSREDVEQGGVDALVALYVRFHAEAEKDESLNDEARAEFHKLELGDEENIGLWQWFIKISLAEYEVTFKKLGITFDSYKGESFYTDKMPAQVEKLRESGLLKIDDGASIVDLSEYKMPPCLILKKDGSTLYPTRDIAAAVYRHDTYGFDRAIYVTSSAQCLHFAQWFKVVELMGYDWYDKLVHVPYGTVSIDGAKLATRTGNVVLLRDLFAQAEEKVKKIIDEKNPDLENRDETASAVGVGAVVFHYLFNSRIKDINFVMEDALSFDGATGPYVQYTYARTCSIIEKAGGVPQGGKLTTDEERALLRVIASFPEKVKKALDDYEPSVITRYVYDLASAFNGFYHNCPINSADDPEVRAFRLRLTKTAGSIIKTALSLICIKAPTKI